MGNMKLFFKYAPLRKTTRLGEKEKQAAEQPSHIDLIAKEQIREQRRVLSVRSAVDGLGFIYTMNKRIFV